MKFVLPIKKQDDESIEFYMAKCRLLLYTFKQLLLNNIQNGKINSRTEVLYNESAIIWTIENTNYDIRSILTTFINNLSCYYDSYDSVCYFTVPKNIKCPYTKTDLNIVIRILEYGGEKLSPLYWIRPTYTQFIESTINKFTKNS